MAFISKLDPNYELFHYLSKHERLKSPLDRLFHISCTQYNLLHVEQKQFAQLYTHPKEPFPEHHKDKHAHIAYNQYKYRKLLHYVTYIMYLFVEYKNNIEFLLENNTLNIVVFTKRQEKSKR